MDVMDIVNITVETGWQNMAEHSRIWQIAIDCRRLRQSVTDLINRIVQILRRDLRQVRISAQEAGLIEPVEPWDKG